MTFLRSNVHMMFNISTLSSGTFTRLLRQLRASNPGNVCVDSFLLWYWTRLNTRNFSVIVFWIPQTNIGHFLFNCIKNVTLVRFELRTSVYKPCMLTTTNNISTLNWLFLYHSYLFLSTARCFNSILDKNRSNGKIRLHWVLVTRELPILRLYSCISPS